MKKSEIPKVDPLCDRFIEYGVSDSQVIVMTGNKIEV